MTSKELFKLCKEKMDGCIPDGFVDFNQFDGRGFFPVASGLFNKGVNDELKPPIQFMFIGQDWGAENGLTYLEEDSDADMKSSTCKNLNDLLKKCKIEINRCFFTNALFAVREGNIAVGKSRGWSDSDLIEKSLEILKFQIQEIQPKVLIFLGLQSSKIFSENITFEINEIEVNYPGNLSWKFLNKATPCLRDAPMELNSIAQTAFLLHPSYRCANLRHRRYGQYQGHDDPEIAFLRNSLREYMQ